MNKSVSIVFVVSLLLCACKEQKEQEVPLQAVINFFGDSIAPQLMHGSKQEAAYSAALAAWEQNPTESTYIWLGRRKAYLQHYHEAIAIFTEALEKFPNSYQLYRHRGHRYISVRQLENAISDFEKAAVLMQGVAVEIEADGIPNKLDTPLSTTQFNVFYHLGLAHYLAGDYARANQAYTQCMEYSTNDDLLVATTDWYYMSLMRLGEQQEAEKLLTHISDSLTIIENDSYYKRLKMYQGKMSPGELLDMDTAAEDYALSIATQGYGVGNWYLMKADTAKAKEIFQSVLDGQHWAAFGYIAAEADMHRLLNQE